ncbi:MAG TPA: transcriptional regulator [Erysipelotrichaceae bacterium]|nr:transcriptional regulator [Erysipelotrichaceae bacterium]
MTRNDFIKMMDSQVKLIRSEYGLTQDKMSILLGLSKKTLVEIEKGRSSLGWTTSVALASIFSNSSVLINALGGNVEDIIVAIAFNDVDVQYPKTWGGKLWWKTILKKEGYMIQQNLVSQHYRLLDPLYRRHYASFDLVDIETHLHELIHHL